MLRKVSEVIFIFANFCCSQTFGRSTGPFFEQTRNMIISSEMNAFEGAWLQLNPKEQFVDNIIVKLKQDEVNAGIKNNSIFAPGLHFFHGKPFMEQSKVFEIIKKIPKGSLLHVHNSAAVSAEWVIKNLTYRPETEYCTGEENMIYFTVGYYENCIDKPVKIVEARNNMSIENRTIFDKWLERQINLYTLQPEIEFPDINSVWYTFDRMFSTMKGLLSYMPFAIDFHYKMLEELYEDGIFYVEIRTNLNQVFVNENGTRYDPVVATNIIQNIAFEFAKTHPNFIGMKVIYALHRNSELLEKNLNIFIQLKSLYPNFIIGIDFVGQEDKGTPLIKLKPFLERLPADTKLFFHAGETNLWGTPVDFNLVDAVLLNVTRIGHGYALLRHPSLWDTIRLRDIAIEISVISNQVLHLVMDLRNHPAATYLALNIPIVICNDDPTFWGAKGLRYDWYLAFMALSPAHAGLKLLKLFALNSIKYSVLTYDERRRYELLFIQRWEEFLDNVIAGYGSQLQ